MDKDTFYEPTELHKNNTKERSNINGSTKKKKDGEEVVRFDLRREEGKTTMIGNTSRSISSSKNACYTTQLKG